MLAVRGNITGSGAATRSIVPADQCAWQEEPSATTLTDTTSRGYKITNVEIIKGVGSLLIQGATFASTARATFVADTAQLGFIGKSGRFVATSELL